MRDRLRHHKLQIDPMEEYLKQLEEYNRKMAEYQAWQHAQGSQATDDTTSMSDVPNIMVCLTLFSRNFWCCYMVLG